MNIQAPYLLLSVIVNPNDGKKTLNILRNLDVSGATIIPARGKVDGKWLKFFELDDAAKEIYWTVILKKRGDELIKALGERLHFDKPYRGIAFTIPVFEILGDRKKDVPESEERDDKYMYRCIIVITEKGLDDEIIDEAKIAGANGATIINARGSAMEEQIKFFGLEINPEKEVIMIISEEDKTDEISQSINKKFNLEKPGHGILFTMPVEDVYGLRT